MAVVCLSVCLSVLGPKSRTERHRKLKIGRKEAHDAGNSWPHLEVRRSKVKIIRSQVKTASVLQQGPQLVASPTICHNMSPLAGDIVLDRPCSLLFWCETIINNYAYLRQWGSGIRGLIRGMATSPGNQELLMVRDKVGRPQVSLW